MAVKNEPEGVARQDADQQKWQIMPDSTVPVLSGNSAGFSKFNANCTTEVRRLHNILKANRNMIKYK
jgi:hypothetical protein